MQPVKPDYLEHKRDYLLVTQLDYAMIIHSHDCVGRITDHMDMWGPVINMTVYPRDAANDRSAECEEAIDKIFPHAAYILNYKTYPALSVLHASMDARIADLRARADRYRQ